MSDIDDLMLTTIDNPYNPKTDYDKWMTWDKENGYNTQEYIARLIEMDDEYNVNIDDEVKLNEINDRVINEILEQDILGVYMLV